MKGRLGAFFKKAGFSKKKRTGLILSIVVLVEVLLIMVVSTSAWVESISSIRIFNTDGSIDPETGQPITGTKGSIESFLYQKATIGSGSAIDLTQYFRPSGNYHLVGASSVDGKTMYFPNFKNQENDTTGLQVRNSASFRLGTVNDKNVNYISFTIKTTNVKDLGFDAVPTIKFGDTDISTATLSDAGIETTGLTEAQIAEKEKRLKSLVRLSVGDNNGDFTVYSLNDEMTDDVVNDENGTLTEDVPVMSFADYVSGKKVVTTTTGGFLSFNLWIQDPFGEFTSIYKNKALTISGLKLIPVTKYTAKVSTNTVVQTQADKHGGTVRVGNSEYDVSVDFYAAAGRQVKLYALANVTKAFQFKGWSETANGTLLTDEDNNSAEPFTYTTKSNVTTIYALFSDERVLYFDPKYNYPKNVQFAAYLWYNDGGTNREEFYHLQRVEMNSQYAGSNNQFYGKFYFAYSGVADKIIFCYMDNTYNNETGTSFWNKRKLQTYDLKFPSGVGEYTYVATCKQIVKDEGTSINYSSDYASGSSGNCFILGYWDFYYANVKAAYHPDSVEKSNANPITDNTITAKLKYSTTDNSTTTYYQTGTSGSGMNRYAYTYLDPIDYKDTIYPTHTYDGKVILKATASSLYDFNGWYSYDADNATYTQETTNTTYTVEPDSDGVVTYYAKFTAKPEYWRLWYRNTSSGDGDYVNMTNISGTNKYTADLTLNNSNNKGDIYFKVKDELRTLWYSDGNTYTDYISDTIVNNASLNTNTSPNMHIDGINGTYTFTFDKDTSKLTVTLSNKTYPSVRLLTKINNVDYYIQFEHRSGDTGNDLYCEKTINEGDAFKFKVNDVRKNEWRRNTGTAGSYDGYITNTILSSADTAVLNNDMYLRGHAGTYTFKYNYQTKKLSITVVYSSIDIYFNTSNTSWFNNDFDTLTVWYKGCDNDNHEYWYEMTYQNNNTWKASVPSNYCKNTRFDRRSNGNTTNYWTANYRNNYYTTYSTSDDQGSWKN